MPRSENAWKSNVSTGFRLPVLPCDFRVIFRGRTSGGVRVGWIASRHTHTANNYHAPPGRRQRDQPKDNQMTKAHVVTPERKRLVEAGASWGVTHGNIATILRISTRTLEKKYRHELDTATDQLVIKTGARLTKQALSKGNTAPNTQARLFIMR